MNYIRSLPILAMLLLTSCDTAFEATKFAAKVTSLAPKLMAEVKRDCSYVIKYSSAVGILGTFIGFSPAGAIAEAGAAICTAVTTLPLADGPGDRKPRVNGVVVKGKFVR